MRSAVQRRHRAPARAWRSPTDPRLHRQARSCACLRLLQSSVEQARPCSSSISRRLVLHPSPELWLHREEDTMYLVRDIMYCKPGNARAMVQKFQALGKLGEQMGMGAMRVMTDVCAERYWTVVSEMEVKSLEEYTEMSRKSMADPRFQEAMKGYHDLLVKG